MAIVQNPDVTSAQRSAAQVFRHDFWGYNLTDSDSHKSYRPLTTYTFRFEWHTFGGGAAATSAYQMKLTNLCLHLLVSGLFLQMLFTLFAAAAATSSVPFLAALLFAVHPVHAEAVSGIVGRADLLCAVCYLIAILISIWMWQRNKIIGYFALLPLAIIALLCKETGITLLVTFMINELK